MWIMSTLRVKRDGEPLEYHIYIGAVKIAEICFNKAATKWIAYLRLMRNDVSYDIKDHYTDMSSALRDLHRLLNSPSPEGATVGARKRNDDPPIS